MSGSNSIEAPNISVAWLKALNHLLDVGGQSSNLLVTIDDPLQVDLSIHQVYEQVLSDHNLLDLKQVTYTIFPRSAYQIVGKSADALFYRYNRKGGIYERLRNRYAAKFRWGSYFRRMTHYPTLDQHGQVVIVNQLKDIIDMLRDRAKTYRAAYTISIQIPGIDRKRTIGGPCLNYVALQLETPKTLNLLAVYRNHDFIQRAYGNYLGLGYLAEFLCDQTGYSMGKLTCLSSNANVARPEGVKSWPKGGELRQIVEGLNHQYIR